MRSKSRPAPLYISIISVGEFGEGFGPAHQQDCRACLQPYTVLDLDRDIAWAASQIARQLRAGGMAIGENDVWNAATAFHHDLALVTNNAHHFHRVAGLRVTAY